MNLRIGAAKALMRAWPPAPIPDDHWRTYETASDSERRTIRNCFRTEVVPAETAARIRERDERAVITCSVAQDAAATDGVPDDLIW